VKPGSLIFKIAIYSSDSLHEQNLQQSNSLAICLHILENMLIQIVQKCLNKNRFHPESPALYFQSCTDGINLSRVGLKENKLGKYGHIHEYKTDKKQLKAALST
jgi:hypothetical protein